MVHCCLSKLVNVVSIMQQAGVLCPLLFLLYNWELFSILKNMGHRGYADGTTLIAAMPSLGIRVTVAELMNRDLGKVGMWCDL